MHQVANPAQLLCRLTDIPAGEAIAVDVVLKPGTDADSVIVLRMGDGVRAYLNACPHLGRRLDWAPGKFIYKDGQLVCAAHGAAFQDDDGACTGGPCMGSGLRALTVSVQDDDVLMHWSKSRGSY